MKRTTIISLAALLLLLPAAGCGGDNAAPAGGAETGESAPLGMVSFFPQVKEIPNLGEPDEYREFEGRRLFELINGGAEDYLALDFVKVGAREYRTDLEENPYLTLHVYDMSSPDSARSIFRKEGHGDRPSAGIGDESRIGGGAMEFTLQGYYVKVRCDLAGAAVDRLLDGTARFVLSRIEADGVSPAGAR